jgi:thiamine transporter ThiT
MDYAELIVARIVGRNLDTFEGMAVQFVALAIFIALIYVGWVSGFIPGIIHGIADWYANRVVEGFTN